MSRSVSWLIVAAVASLARNLSGPWPAAALMPHAQSAKIAMARLTFRRGHRDRAAEQIRALAAETPPTETADPRVWYTKGTAWRASNYLHEMRRLVRAKK